MQDYLKILLVSSLNNGMRRKAVRIVDKEIDWNKITEFKTEYFTATCFNQLLGH